MCVAWRIHMCDVTHPYVSAAFLLCSVHVCDDPFTCVASLFHMCGMTYSYVWQRLIHMYLPPFYCVPCMCEISHSYVWRVSFICVAWRIHMCDMTHPYVSSTLLLCSCFLPSLYYQLKIYLGHIRSWIFCYSSSLVPKKIFVAAVSSHKVTAKNQKLSLIQLKNGQKKKLVAAMSEEMLRLSFLIHPKKSSTKKITFWTR